MESAVGRLYRYYAERLPNDPEASAFFFKLSLEENSHASIIRFQRKIAWQNPDLFSPIPLDVEEVRAIIKDANLRSASSESPTLHEAMAVAGQIESSAVELHYRFAVRPSEPSFGQMVARLGGHDKEHAERVMEFAAQRSIRLFLRTGESPREAISA